MIDIATEQPIPLLEAARLAGPLRNGRPPHPDTIARWGRIGVRGIRLELILVGGTRCTTREAMQRFFDALTEQATLSSPPRSAPAETPTRTRRRQLAEADRVLAAEGML